MKIGLSLSGLLQHTAESDMVQRFEEVLDLVRTARDCGFDYIYAGQHYLTTPYQMMQPLISLARLSAETGNMGLLSTILVPLLNPVQIAEDVATLDVISGGRITINAALGYRDLEFDAFGIEKDKRVQRMFENLDIAKILWSGEKVSFQNQYIKISNTNIGVTPVQKPHPKIWIAANSDAMVRRISSRGEVWYMNPHSSLSNLKRQFELYKEDLSNNGHSLPADIPIAREMFIARSRDDAYAIARPFLESKYKAYAAWGQDKAISAEENFSSPFEVLSDGRFILGTPNDALVILDQIRNLGVTHATLRLGWPGMSKKYVESAILLTAQEVMPALNA